MERLYFERLLFLLAVSSLLNITGAQRFSLRGNDARKHVSVEDPPTLTSTEETNDLIEKWELFDRNIKRVLNEGIKRIMPILMERYDKSNISSSCMRNALSFIAGLKESRLWAFNLLDASGKAVDGLLSGSMASLGEYDQCINTVAINERKGRNYGKVLFNGKYCALDLRPSMPPKKRFYKINEVIEELKNFSKKGTIAAEMAKSAHFFHFLTLRIGICVPSGCSREDISSALHNIMEVMEDNMWSVTVKRCEIKEKLKITPTMMFVGAVYGFFGLLLVLGTTVDVAYYYKGQKICGVGLKILRSFSFVTNFRRLVNTNISAEALACLNGVRVLSITWIILGHSYLNINYQIFRGVTTAAKLQESFDFQAVVNAAIAVDTFFFMGGLVLCYPMVKVMTEKKKPFNLFFYIFHRIWRIMPLYLSVILIGFMIPIMGNGPIWHDTVDHTVEACYNNWWTNLVFLNNYVHAEHMCLPHSWYIAADMQLYLFSLIILLPLLRLPKVGISLAVLCVIFSMMASSLVTYWNSFPPTMLFVHPDIEQRTIQQVTTYFKPYPHAGPYCIGILVGYLLATKPSARFPRVVLIFGWCAAIICNLSVLYGVWEWNKGRDATFWETMFYSGCHRAAWALGVAWVVICCATGQGGVVRYILTWKAWVPISRLTYAAYLIHPVIQITVVGTLRMKVQPYHYFTLWLHFGHLMVSYAVAFALSMLIEAPSSALEKIFLQKEEQPEDAMKHA